MIPLHRASSRAEGNRTPLAKLAPAFVPALVPALVVVAVAAGAGFLAGRWWPEEPPALEASTALFGEERALPEFALTDHTGGRFTLRNLSEDWTLLFFGYTHCPDVCPITLATMSASLDAIAALGGEAPRVVFVSVDPERDTPPGLRSYVSVFRESFLGVTGPHEELTKLTRALGVGYARDGDGPGYLVEHSAALLLVNPKGRLQAVFGPPHAPDPIARDFIAIRRHLES